MRTHRAYATSIVSTAVLVAGLAVPVAAAPSAVPTKVYKACADRESGAIRLVVKGRQCRKSEIRLSWNVQGPTGMAGPVGPQGPAGATGPQGAPGLSGEITIYHGVSSFTLTGPSNLGSSPIAYADTVHLYVGFSQTGLFGPHAIGAVTYRPTSLVYCLADPNPGSAVEDVRVVRHVSPLGQSVAVKDDTDRSAAGCYYLALPSTSVADLGYEFVVNVKGPPGGFVRLASLAVVWSPSTT